MTHSKRITQLAWLIAPIVVMIAFAIVEVSHLVHTTAIGNLDYFPLVDRGLALGFTSWDGWVNWIHPVGFPWLVRIGLELGFDAARWGQFLSVSGGLIGLIGAYLIAWSLTNSHKIALACEIFVATTGYMLFYASVEGNDMLGASLQILSIGLLALGLARAPIGTAPKARRVFVASLTAGLAYLIRYTGMITIGVSGLMLIGLALQQRHRSMWKLVALYLVTVVAVTSLQWIPSWIVTGSPLSNDQGKNVYFHLYGNFDFITDWNAQPANISLLQVIVSDPGKFLRHWWEIFQSFWFSPKMLIAEVPLKLFGQAGFVFMILMGASIRASLRVLLALFLFAHLAALSMLRLDPRFLLIFIPILVAGAVYFFARLLPARWTWRRFTAPVQAAAAIIGVCFALPIAIGFASDQPATPPYLIEASDVLYAGGMQTAHEVLSTDLRLQDLSALSRKRFTQANDWRTLPHDTLPQLLDAAHAQGFRFLIYDKDAGPKIYPNLPDLLSPEKRHAGLTPIYIQPDEEFVIYRIENQSASTGQVFAQLDQGIVLQQYQINASRPFTETNSRDVGVYLSWQAQYTIALSYKVFVHVIDDSGQVVAQDDSQPVLWLHPTTDWTAGETVIDFHFIRLANVDPAKKYAVIVGLYDEATGARLNRLDASGQSIDDKIVLRQIELK